MTIYGTVHNIQYMNLYYIRPSLAKACPRALVIVMIRMVVFLVGIDGSMMAVWCLERTDVQSAVMSMSEYHILLPSACFGYRLFEVG